MPKPTIRRKIEYDINTKMGNCIYLGDDIIENNIRYGFFKCECGNQFRACVSKVKAFHTRSCGCIHSKQIANRNFRHGLRKLHEYSLWLNMRQRCYNPKFKNYKHWGGRGITICASWYASFENFYNDMGKQPAKRWGIDRIDVNGNYCKENCRWAGHKIQNNNRRDNVHLENNGIILTIGQWAEKLNMSYSKLYRRYRNKKNNADIFSA